MNKRLKTRKQQVTLPFLQIPIWNEFEICFAISVCCDRFCCIVFYLLKSIDIYSNWCLWDTDVIYINKVICFMFFYITFCQLLLYHTQFSQHCINIYLVYKSQNICHVYLLLYFCKNLYQAIFFSLQMLTCMT